MADPRAVVARFYDEVLNGKHLGVLDDLAAPDFVEHGTPPIVGIDGFRGFLESLSRGLPDVQLTVHDWIVDNDRVVARCLVSGTHRGELFGYRPTDKPISWTAIHIWRVHDGRLAERWSEVNMLAIIDQLRGRSSGAT